MLEDLLGMQVGFEQGEKNYWTKHHSTGKMFNTSACNISAACEEKALMSFLFLQGIQSKLKVVCNELGLLKSKCHKFVNKYLGILIEELTTTDDVRTICVNTGACK
ncbi:hypothetical protein GOODEAATRI_016317 [Goodea atripinnis]|uniref:Saposin B-type domain-containing protein n=1 Tax=Goodea atripinnis TaxID=208336 RepID=A0ABV0PYJ1_9TELE